MPTRALIVKHLPTGKTDWVLCPAVKQAIKLQVHLLIRRMGVPRCECRVTIGAKR